MLGGITGESKLPALAVLLLLAGAMAGCIGGQGTDEDVDPTNTEDPATDPPDTNLEETAYNFQGQAAGGLGLQATGSYFWTVSDVPSYEINLPESFERGNLSFAWEAAATLGGVMLIAYDDGEQIHKFHADSSPYETELEANDDRLHGADSISIVPEWEPASVPAMVAWTIELSVVSQATASQEDTSSEA